MHSLVGLANTCKAWRWPINISRLNCKTVRCKHAMKLIGSNKTSSARPPKCMTKSPLTMQTRGWSRRSAHLLWRKPWALIRKYSWEFMVGSWVPWKRFESCWLTSKQKAILLQQRSPIRYHRQIHGLYLRITRFHGFQRFLNLAGAHDPQKKTSPTRFAAKLEACPARNCRSFNSSKLKLEVKAGKVLLSGWHSQSYLPEGKKKHHHPLARGKHALNVSPWRRNRYIPGRVLTSWIGNSMAWVYLVT